MKTETSPRLTSALFWRFGQTLAVAGNAEPPAYRRDFSSGHINATRDTLKGFMPTEIDRAWHSPGN